MEIRYEYSLELPALLKQHKLALAITTYQAGHVVLVSPGEDRPTVSMHQFDRPMGIASNGRVLAVAAADAIWFMHNNRNLPRPEHATGNDHHFYLARQAQVTGEIHAHDVQWVGSELWVVNTRFSCLCTLHPEFSFVPRWKPRFISELAAEDRCHLNGLAVDQEGPRLVTVLAETDTAQGWRPNKATSGCLIDVRSGETILRGLSMPHSPRLHRDAIWLLDSGTGRLLALRPGIAQAQTVARFPGFTRGLSLWNHLAFVGLSKIRETSTFGGLPIAERRRELKCGVGIVDVTTGELAATFEFSNGVEEIFDVHVLPAIDSVDMLGPLALKEERNAIWIVPEKNRL